MSRNHSARRPRRNRSRPTFELLEVRLAPALVHWTLGADGDWNAPANWENNHVPRFGDTAVLDTPNVTIRVRDVENVDAVQNSATLDILNNGRLNVGTPSSLGGTVQLEAGGTLSAQASGPITLAGSTAWTGGSLSSNGQGFLNTGTLTLSGSNDATLTTLLTNQGTIAETGTGNLVDNYWLVNSAQGKIDFQSDAGITGNGQLDNRGTIQKSAGAGVSTIVPSSANSPLYFNQLGGTLDAQSGTLQLNGVRTDLQETGGTWDAENQAVLDFVGNGPSGTYFAGTFTGTGNGTVQLDGGNFGIDTGGATFNFPAGLLHWTGGTFFGQPWTNAGTITLSGAGEKDLSATLNNNATLIVMDTGNLVLAGTLSNGGRIDFQSDAGITGSGQLDNRGTIQKSAGAGVSSIAPSSANSPLYFNQLGGTLDAQSGTLQLNGVRTNLQETGGTWNAENHAVLDFVGNGPSGTYFAGTFTGSGSGTVQLDGGNFGIDTGGATFDFPSGLLHWTGGAFFGQPWTNAGVLALSGTADKGLTNLLVNNGTLIQTGTGNLVLTGYGTLTSNASGVYDLQSDAGIVGNSGTFNNAGLFRKSGGAGVSTLGPPSPNPGSAILNFNNTGGTLDAESGRLNLAGGGFWQSATLDAGPNAVLEVSGGPAITGLFTGSGAGRVEFSGGFDPVDGGVAGALATFNFPQGFVHWTGGEMGGGGSASYIGSNQPLVNAGFLTLDGAGVKSVRRNDLINTGTIVDAGPGDLVLNGLGDFATSVFDNQAGATFILQGDNNVEQQPVNGNIGVFMNEGTVVKTAGTGVAKIVENFNSSATGVIDVQSGTLELAGGGTSTGGTFNVDSHAVLQCAFVAYAYNWSGTYTGSGQGTIDFQGQLSGGADSSPAILNFPAGYFDMSGSWFGTIENDGTLNVNGNFVRAHIVNVGTILHTGTADLELNANSFFENRGVYDLQSDANLDVPDDASGGTVQFLNTGTLRKSGSTGTSQLRHHDGDRQAFQLNNLGTVEVDTGTLAVVDPLAQLSGTTLTGGTWIARNGATLAFPTGSTIVTNQGNVTLDGAATTFSSINGLATNQGTLSLTNGAALTTAGNLTNNGTLAMGPGSSLTVQGNLTETAPCRVQVTIGGTVASGQFGRLNVTGAASLAGSLAVQLAPGFGPTQGDVYPVVTYASAPTGFGVIAGLKPFFTATAGATSVQLTAGASAANLAVQSITVPAGGTVGQMVSIPFTVANTTTIPIAGDWTDSVYLSPSATFGPDAVLFTRVPHSGGLAVLTRYTATASAVVPGVIDGAYHVIVVADSADQVPDTNRADNVLVSSGTAAIAVPPLTLGTTPTSGSIVNGQDQLYRIDVPVGAGDLLLSVALAVSREADVYLRYAALPSSAAYSASFANQTGLQGQVVLPSTQQGPYYVLVHGREGAATPQSFTLTARLAGFEIRGVSPTQGGNLGLTTVTVTGSGFTPDSVVRLGAGAVTRTATTVLYKDSDTLYATFDLTRLAPGSYDVAVANGTPSTSAAGAFTVVPGSPGLVQFALSTASVIRVGAVSTATITYTNVGGEDAPAPLVTLSSANALFRLNPQDPWQTGSLQLLGDNPNGPAGILPPGATGSIVVQFQPINQGIHIASDLTVRAVADLTRTIDWASQQASRQPLTLSASAWNAVYANFVALVGSTVGSYQAALDSAATYLSTLGEATPDVTRLRGVVFQLADNFGEVSQRNTLGQFGWGVFGPNDVNVLSTPDGQVAVLNGNQQRRFLPTAAGATTFHGLPGDPGTGTLDTEAGTFVVRDTDGSTATYALTLVGGRIVSGRLAATQDANGNTVTYTTHGSTDSFGNTTSYSTDAQGDVIVTDPVGRTTTYAFDASRNLTSVTAAAGTTSFSYVPGSALATLHALQSITFPDGTHEFFQYDSLGRIKQSNYDNNTGLLTYAYDANGQVTIANTDGARTVIAPTDLGQYARVQDPLGQFAAATFDANHNPTQVRGAQGSPLTASYDARGNPTRITGPSGDTIGMTYNPTTDSLTGLTDARGVTTGYASDRHGNLVTTTYADGSTLQYRYDPVGNLIQKTDPLGQATHYRYDAHNLLTNVTYADGSSIGYTYDAHRNLATATNAAGTTIFSYDAADRLTRAAYPDGKFVAYVYNAQGERTRLFTQDGATVNTTYDAVGRLSRLTDGAGQLIAFYHYDADGRLSRTDLGNGTSTAYGYDLSGNTTSIVTTAADHSVVSSFVYTYDGLGRPVTVTTLDGKTTYGYDAGGQLTSVALPGGRTVTYQYDAAGNRTGVTDTGITSAYTTNNLNETTNVGATRYTYDAAGHVTGKTDASGTTIYTYNAAGQLVTVTAPADTWTYQYDALGNLASTTHNGQATENLVDPTQLGNVVAQYQGNSLLASYTYGVGLASQVTGAGSAYYSFDATGNTANVTGAGGTVLDRYAYLPYGEPLSATGSTPNPFTFGGQYGVSTDGNGLLFMRNRWYDPQLGRFAERDPLGLGGLDTNLYRYAQNDPTREIDPQGLLGGFDRQLAALLIRAGADPATLRDIFETQGLLTAAKDAKYAQLFKDALALSDAAASRQAANIAAAAGNVGIESWPVIEDVAAQQVAKQAGKQAAGKLVAKGALRFLGPVGTAVTVAQVGYGAGTLIRHGANYLSGNGVDEGWQEIFSWSNPAPDDILSDRAKARVEQRAPGDPNDISGPAGFGAANLVADAAAYPYRIDFENKPSADAPAQVVTVTQTLDTHLDGATFQLGSFGFGGQTFAVPAGLTAYTTRIDARATVGVYVDVSADFDATTGKLAWTFRSVDPATGDLPADVLTGFLPPNVKPPQGDAFISYTVQPKAGLATGTPIGAKGTVIFDAGLSDQSSLDTPAISNTIDSGAPTSSVNPLPAVSTSSFPVSWSGQDDSSGVATYDVYYSDNGGPALPLVLGTAATTATFTGGQDGHTYAFYSLATDNVGNVQVTPAPSQSTTVSIADRLALQAPTQVVAGGTFTVTVNAVDPLGLTDPAANGSAALLVSSPPAGGKLGGVLFAPIVNGSATFANLSLNQLGAYKLVAADHGDLLGASATITATPQPHFTIAANASTVTAGQPFHVTVTAQLPGGAPYLGTIHFSSSDTNPLLGLPRDYTFQPGDHGQQTFTNVTLATAGKQTIRVADLSTRSVTTATAPIVVNAGALAGFAVAGYPLLPVSGTTHAFTVTAVDGFGNPVSYSGPPVQLTSSDGLFVPPPPVTLVKGTGTGKATLVALGPQTLTASATVGNVTLHGAETGIDVQSTATHFVIGLAPRTTAGLSQFTITPEDAANHVVPFQGMLGFTSSDRRAQLPAAQPFVAAANGSMQLPLTLESPGTQTLNVACLLPAVRGSATTIVSAGSSGSPATHLGLTLAPPGAKPAVTAGGSITVLVTPLGPAGTDTQFQDELHFTSSDPGAGVPADQRFSATFGAHGSESFSIPLQTAGNQTLTVTDLTRPGLTGATLHIAVTAGAVKTLSVTGFPVLTLAGATHSFQVKAVDRFGNPVPGYTGTISFAGSSATLATPLRNYTFTAGDRGVHTFTVAVTASGTLLAADLHGGLTLAPEAVTVTTPTATLTPPNLGIAAPLTYPRGQPLTFTLAAAEPGAAANAAFTFLVDWTGDGKLVQAIPATTVTHVFPTTGTFAIHVRAVDALGNVGPTTTLTLTSNGADLETDPQNAALTALVIGGTPGNDTITLTPLSAVSAAGQTLSVAIDGATPAFTPTGHVIVYGQAGTDVIREINSQTQAIGIPALFFAGAGNSTLSVAGSAANNVLVGGAGNDALTAGNGNDLLIGGAGSDTLTAGSGNAILIGGTTQYDANLAALLTLIQEWGQQTNFESALHSLFGPGVGPRLNLQTVARDSAVNTLTGGTGLDWFWLSANAKATDKLSGFTSGDGATFE